jgi:hypothetical protein
MSVRVIGPKDGKDIKEYINTTSRSTTWSKGLSPFFLGPCKLAPNAALIEYSQNMENAWQYSKVYSNQVDIYGDPTNAYWTWAVAGWRQSWANRYPMGKGATPLYSWWDGEKLGYIEARKKIYIPLYRDAVKDTAAFRLLKEQYKLSGNSITLWDFDGYDYQMNDMSLSEVIDHSSRKMGHAFVLAMMLEGKI